MNRESRRNFVKVGFLSLLEAGCSRVKLCPQPGRICDSIDQFDQLGMLGRDEIIYKVLLTPESPKRVSVNAPPWMALFPFIHCNGRFISLQSSDGFLLSNGRSHTAFRIQGVVNSIHVNDSLNIVYALVRKGADQYSLVTFKLDGGIELKEIPLPQIREWAQLSSNENYICIATEKQAHLIPQRNNGNSLVVELGNSEICPVNNSVVGLGDKKRVTVIDLGSRKTLFISSDIGSRPRWHSTKPLICYQELNILGWASALVVANVLDQSTMSIDPIMPYKPPLYTWLRSIEKITL